ncbi:glutathione S-transferase L3-like protein isoform X1 [Tanacetum coccineum]
MSTSSVKEVLPQVLDSTSPQPTLFDGTTRLYTNLQCPYAQRVWITRNYKGKRNLKSPTKRAELLALSGKEGLQDQMKLVPIDLANRPAWYKEKVYPKNKVPALEHDNKITGESLDLMRYVNAHFEGPALLPNDSAKREFAEELFTYTDTFNKTVRSSVRGDTVKEGCIAFDYLESALQKFEGPFFLGEISMVDFAYIPFVERFQLYLQDVYKYDICIGRPQLATWIEELNKIDAYVETKVKGVSKYDGTLDEVPIIIQDNEKGWISDRPDDAVDDTHTYFGDAGLSLFE